MRWRRWKRGLTLGLLLAVSHAFAQPALIADPPPGKSEKDQEIESGAELYAASWSTCMRELDYKVS